jgi:HAD superfamily hydrolase (TIGR01450 family)
VTGYDEPWPTEPHLSGLRDKASWLFDGDGVLYQDGRALPGAADLVGLLRWRGYRLALLTNSSVKTREQIAAEVQELGIDIRPEEITTTADVAVSEAMPFRSAMILGGKGIHAACIAADVRLVDPFPRQPPEPVDVVFIGMDRELSYDRLTAAMRAIRQGARFIATNRDAVFPAAGGGTPGAGSVVAAVSAAVGREPDLTVGKPEAPLFLEALRSHHGAPEHAVMIGDQLETDIRGAALLKIDTLLVRSGLAADRTDAEIRRFRRRHLAPTHIVDALSTVVRALSEGDV